MVLSKIIQNIQYILAPAIMISSASLLLLGFQNKFSALFNRFRSLNEEKRHLKKKMSRDAVEIERLENLEQQLTGLLFRARCVKNAILGAYFAIIAFLATSFFIFLGIYFAVRLEVLMICCFTVGLGFLFISSVLIVTEVSVAYRILKLERKS